MIAKGTKIQSPMGEPTQPEGKSRNNTHILWLIIHKVVAANEWHGIISTEIDKSCPHYGLQSVELIEHKFYSYPLIQRMLLISFDNSLPKERTLAQGNPFP